MSPFAGRTRNADSPLTITLNTLASSPSFTDFTRVKELLSPSNSSPGKRDAAGCQPRARVKNGCGAVVAKSPHSNAMVKTLALPSSIFLIFSDVVVFVGSVRFTTRISSPTFNSSIVTEPLLVSTCVPDAKQVVPPTAHHSQAQSAPYEYQW